MGVKLVIEFKCHKITVAHPADTQWNKLDGLNVYLRMRLCQAVYSYENYESQPKEIKS